MSATATVISLSRYIGTMEFQISVGLPLFFSQIFANPYSLIPHPTIIKFWTFCFSLLLFRALRTLIFRCEEKPRLNLPSYQEKTYTLYTIRIKIKSVQIRLFFVRGQKCCQSLIYTVGICLFVHTKCFYL